MTDYTDFFLCFLCYLCDLIQKTQITMAKQELNPMMKQFYDLKEKHPTAILLFRCGDFYECYEQDACICAKELGITLTKAEDGTHMAGFPYHALDTYLPKLVRYCSQPESIMKRVAICDQLEPPTPTKKRGITELVSPGIAETTNNSNNSKSSTTMAKKNMTKNENQNVQNAQVANTAITPIKVAEGSVPMSPEAFLAEHGDIEDAEFEEVTAGTEVKSEEVKSEKSLPAVTFSTYKTKKGDIAPQIIGFGGEDDPRYKAVKESGAKWVSAGWKKDLNGNKVYILLFGVRYMDVAKALAGAYNTPDVDAWHRAEDACMAIYEQAQRDGKARWEEKKQQWAAARSEKLKVKSEELAAAESAEKQVAAMLEKLMKGEDVPESILKHIDPEVLAKFTKAA